MYDLPCFRTSSPNYGAAVDKSLPTCFQHKEIFQPQRNKLKCCPQTAFDNSLDRISSVFLLYGILQRMVSTCRVYQRGSGRTPSNAPQISMANIRPVSLAILTQISRMLFSPSSFPGVACPLSEMSLCD